MRVLLSLAALICLAVSAAVAQDPVVADADHIKLEFENAQVRVMRYSYAPGEKSPVHDHLTTILIALTDQDAKSTANGKTTDFHAKAGQVFWRNAIKHTWENVGTTPSNGILVEIKGAPSEPKPGSAK
jgi:quercetin dioxygenase-like cupin family protein